MSGSNFVQDVVEVQKAFLELQLAFTERLNQMEARLAVAEWLSVKLSRLVGKSDLDLIISQLSAGPERMFLDIVPDREDYYERVRHVASGIAENIAINAGSAP